MSLESTANQLNLLYRITHVFFSVGTVWMMAGSFKAHINVAWSLKDLII